MRKEFNGWPRPVGGWSDSTKTTIGRRFPFIFAGGLLLVLILILMLFSTNHLLWMGIELALFFIAYFSYFPTYYALFPDHIPQKYSGISQGIQGAFRSFGMLLALVGGGFLLHIWIPLPFIIVILVVIIDTIILFYTLKNKIQRPNMNKRNLKIEWLAEWKLIRDHKRIRLWFIANTFWETAISILKVFIVLYFTRGLNFTLSQTSAALSLVGLAAVFAAPIAGKLADQHTHRPVILISLVIFALGLFPPLFTTNLYFIAAIIPVAFSAVILMTLPYSLLMKYLPKVKQHGAGAALFLLCQGVGALFGPLLTGFCIQGTKNINFLVFKKTQGYVAIFPVASLFLIVSIPFTIWLFRYKYD